MKFIFGIILFFWGLQLLIESFFGLNIPFLRLLVPFVLILAGLWLIQKPDWDFSYFSFNSKLIFNNSQKFFSIDELKNSNFTIKYSDCVFDGSINSKNSDIKLWINAKKSHIGIVCNKSTHTIIYLLSTRTVVHYPNTVLSQKNKHSFQRDFDTIHIGNMDQRPTVFYHVQAKDCVIEISEK